MCRNLSDKIVVRPAYQNEWNEAMGIAWKTFLRFEAPIYPAEGVKSFYEFITDEMLCKMFRNGTYLLFVATLESKMTGIITLRDKCHISLLFVDPENHRCGIGRALMEYLSKYMKTFHNQDKMTVNASPYAIPFYHKLGFTDLGPEVLKDGIIYTPMEIYL